MLRDCANQVICWLEGRLRVYPMVKLYRAALQLRKPLCLQGKTTVVCVSLVSLGCFLVLFVTTTFQNDAWSNTALSTFILLEIMGSDALQLLENFHQNQRIERVALIRTQRGKTRES